MPRTIVEVQKQGKVGVKRVGGKKLDFAPILARIVSSRKAYTVKEVRTGKDMVNNVLSHQRVYKLLNKAVVDKKLTKMTMSDGDYYFDYEQRKQ